MTPLVSLRWRLVLFSWSLALGIALVLTVLLHLRTERQLLGQLEKTLETKCEEVITVLESASPHPMLEDFLYIETNYRSTPYTYFYVIRDDTQILEKSDNLGAADLPIPRAWPGSAAGPRVLLETTNHPQGPAKGKLRLRSERVRVAMTGRGPADLVIQTGVSLAPLDQAVSQTLRDALFLAGGGLAVIFFLTWFVTTRSLQPVTAMTRKASQITAAKLRERLPVSGTADELDELAGVLNDMLDRLGGSLRQMEQFSSGAAHQLRTPLTRIRGELELILRTELADPARGQLERIQEELDRLSRLCGRLLLLARLDQQAASASLFDERVDLEPVVAELIEQMTPLAKDHGVALRNGPTSPTHVLGSRPLLVEALLNLLHNAIRATREGGQVTVSLDRMGDAVHLAVQDEGPGVPPEERERIFQPFYRLARAPSGPSDEGSGLGLAIVSRIALAHGGRVELADGPRGGSVFRLVLPAAAAS